VHGYRTEENAHSHKKKSRHRSFTKAASYTRQRRFHADGHFRRDPRDVDNPKRVMQLRGCWSFHSASVFPGKFPGTLNDKVSDVCCGTNEANACHVDLMNMYILNVI
jgi:hypothetical protein